MCSVCAVWRQLTRFLKRCSLSLSAGVHCSSATSSRLSGGAMAGDEGHGHAHSHDEKKEDHGHAHTHTHSHDDKKDAHGHTHVHGPNCDHDHGHVHGPDCDHGERWQPSLPPRSTSTPTSTLTPGCRSGRSRRRDMPRPLALARAAGPEATAASRGRGAREAGMGGARQAVGCGHLQPS